MSTIADHFGRGLFVDTGNQKDVPQSVAANLRANVSNPMSNVSNQMSNTGVVGGISGTQPDRAINKAATPVRGEWTVEEEVSALNHRNV